MKIYRALPCQRLRPAIQVDNKGPQVTFAGSLDETPGCFGPEEGESPSGRIVFYKLTKNP